MLRTGGSLGMYKEKIKLTRVICWLDLARLMSKKQSSCSGDGTNSVLSWLEEGNWEAEDIQWTSTWWGHAGRPLKGTVFQGDIRPQITNWCVSNPQTMLTVRKDPSKWFPSRPLFFLPLYSKVPALERVNYYWIKLGTTYKNWLNNNLCVPHCVAARKLREQMKNHGQTLSSSCGLLDRIKMSSL